MLKRIVLPLVATLAAVLVAPGPAQSTEPTITDNRQLTVRASLDPPPPLNCAGLPCWPNCLYQVFPCWEIRSLNYFTNNPVEAMPTLCISGRLQLGAGYYDWGYIWPDHAVGHKVLQNRYVGAGWYGMETCMDPRDNHTYTRKIALYPDNPAWEPWVVYQQVAFEGPSSWIGWGVYLDPLF